MALVSTPQRDKAAKPHAYAPLKSENHIRILLLEPSIENSGPLCFSFEQIHIDSAEDEYEAISYTWGEPILSHQLHHADSTTIKITKNLDSALRLFRHATKIRRLWADAACINQADNTEKATQIPLMRDIFRNASGVLAWLGDLKKRKENPIKLLRQISRPTVSENQNTTSSPPPDRTVEIIASFFEVPWFHRRWIIQEMVVNLDITLFYGDASISWSRFLEAFKAIESWDLGPKTTSLDRRNISMVSQILRLWEQWCRNDWNHSADIVSLMRTFDRSGCTDPRDAIYALCGLSISGRNDSRSVPFEITYDTGVHETYANFAYRAMTYGYTSQILTCAFERKSFSADSGLPSWVPDWRKFAPDRDRPYVEQVLSETCRLVPDSTQAQLMSIQLDFSVACLFNPKEPKSALIPIKSKANFGMPSDSEPYPLVSQVRPAWDFFNRSYDYVNDEFSHFEPFFEQLFADPASMKERSYFFNDFEFRMRALLKEMIMHGTLNRDVPLPLSVEELRIALSRSDRLETRCVFFTENNLIGDDPAHRWRRVPKPYVGSLPSSEDRLRYEQNRTFFGIGTCELEPGDEILLLNHMQMELETPSVWMHFPALVLRPRIKGSSYSYCIVGDAMCGATCRYLCRYDNSHDVGFVRNLYGLSASTTRLTIE